MYKKCVMHVRISVVVFLTNTFDVNFYTEISRKSFQKFRELLNFRSANYEPKLLEIPGAKLNGKKTPGKIF